MTGKDMLEKLSAMTEAELQLSIMCGYESGCYDLDMLEIVCDNNEPGDSDYISCERAIERAEDEEQPIPAPVAIFLYLGDVL